MMERMRELSLCHSSSRVESDTSMPLPQRSSQSGSCNYTQQQSKLLSGWRTLKEIEERSVQYKENITNLQSILFNIGKYHKT